MSALYPLPFDASSATPGTSEYHRDPSLRRLVEFFCAKGLPALKQADRQEGWYPDWIEYQTRHQLYASLLSPGRYSSLGHRFGLLKLARFLEVGAYFSPAHVYSLHVSLLGLFPVLMSSNEAIKKEAISRLEAGGIFAFGVSEKAHGSDLLANEFTVAATGSGGWIAHGAKHYIGNANSACMISVLGRKVEAGSTVRPGRAPFVFFVLRPGESPAVQNVQKIRTLGIRTAFVGQFEVRGHAFPDSDIISQGHDAWDAIFGTVIFGRFFLGFGAVGICEHAFAEAFAHMRGRVLYGKPAIDLPHIRTAASIAFARLMAMKLYAYRALDYLQVSCDEDRRYLLFTAVQKARVSTEGVKVLALLSECIGARGFESETYFESALRDAQLIPGLEGSTHINFRLIAQFIDAYFATDGRPASEPLSPAPHATDGNENPYWTTARDRNARTTRFAVFLEPYEALRSVPNVRLFLQQLEAFRLFVGQGLSILNPDGEVGLAIALGKCLAIVAYAQLVSENCSWAKVPHSAVSCMFHGLIEDLSIESLKLASLFSQCSSQHAQLREVIRIPETSDADFTSVGELIGASYEK